MPSLCDGERGCSATIILAGRIDSVAAIVLIGCGTFDESTRKILQANLDRRLSPEQKELMQGELSTDEDLAKMGELMSIYSCELDSTPLVRRQLSLPVDDNYLCRFM